MNEEHKAWGAPKRVLGNRGFCVYAKKCLYQGVIVQMALYGAEAWSIRSAERRKANVLEIKYLKGSVGGSRIDGVWRSAGIERLEGCRYHISYGYRRVSMTKVSGRRVPGRPRLGWTDGVKMALGSRGMTVEPTRR